MVVVEEIFRRLPRPVTVVVEGASRLLHLAAVPRAARLRPLPSSASPKPLPKLWEGFLVRGVDTMPAWSILTA